MINKVKTWLKKSGINYSLAGARSFQGTEMIDSLNPFDVIIEDPEYPLAKIYRESAWTGIMDVWEILMGDHYDLYLTGHGRKGVLDLLIFPVIGRRLVGYSFEQTSNPILSFFARIVGYLLEIPRGILAGVLTFALSPIVGVVHLFAYFTAKRLYGEIHNRLKVKDISKVPEQGKEAPKLEKYDVILKITKKDDLSKVKFLEEMRLLSKQNQDAPILLFIKEDKSATALIAVEAHTEKDNPPELYKIYIFGNSNGTKWKLSSLTFPITEEYIDASLIPKEKQIILLKKEQIKESIYQHIASKEGHTPVKVKESVSLGQWIEETNQLITASRGSLQLSDLVITAGLKATLLELTQSTEQKLDNTEKPTGNDSKDAEDDQAKEEVSQRLEYSVTKPNRVTKSEENNFVYLSGKYKRIRKLDNIAYVPCTAIDETKENLRGIHAIRELGLCSNAQAKRALNYLENSILSKEEKRMIIVGGIFKEKRGDGKPMTILNHEVMGKDSLSPLSMIFDFAGCATKRQENIARETRQGQGLR